MKKILITGGAGFIGSHLADELIRRGFAVCIIDDLSTGSIKNIDHLKGKKNFKYVLETIFNEGCLRGLIDECDIVFHLAAAVGVFLVVHDPVGTIEKNVHGTELVLKLTSLKKKKVILASTSEVYGKNPNSPLSEKDDLLLGPTINSRWSYACSKAIDEFMAIAYFKKENLPVVIVRIFNTVGPRQTGAYGMVLPRFIERALKNEPIPVFADGKQTRCFCYVKDTVTALIDFAESDSALGQIFNIGNPQEISIVELAQKVKKITKSKSKLEYIPYSKAYEKGFEDMRRRVPDISKAGKIINFKPTFSIDEIIKRTTEYCRKGLF